MSEKTETKPRKVKAPKSEAAHPNTLLTKIFKLDLVEKVRVLKELREHLEIHRLRAQEEAAIIASEIDSAAS